MKNIKIGNSKILLALGVVTFLLGTYANNADLLLLSAILVCTSIVIKEIKEKKDGN